MTKALCYCGSKYLFSNCCGSLISGEKEAESPEALMRSRYSAYASKQAKYIYETYAKISQHNQSIEDISAWANTTHWLQLSILNASPFDAEYLIRNKHATVEFSAVYRENESIYRLSELSRFIIEDRKWRYIEGDIKEHQELKVHRNALCPCLSGKKYKRCCY